jgi:protein-disulfide isomerase
MAKWAIPMRADVVKSHAVDIALAAIALVALVYGVRPRLAVQERGSIASVPVGTVVEFRPSTAEGHHDAPVVILEVSDFQCPYCRQFASDISPVLEKEYVATGIARVAFVHMPNTVLHPIAMFAAEGAECAAQQGRFQRMRAGLFAVSRNLDTASIGRAASETGLDSVAFKSCMDGASTSNVAAAIDHDNHVVKQLGLDGTPTILIGRRVSDERCEVVSTLVGIHAIDAYTRAIDSIVKEVKRQPSHH